MYISYQLRGGLGDVGLRRGDSIRTLQVSTETTQYKKRGRRKEEAKKKEKKKKTAPYGVLCTVFTYCKYTYVDR